jgi:RimJ/RimL family protein N-acetyltransferase
VRAGEGCVGSPEGGTGGRTRGVLSLPDGTSVAVRPVSPSDAPALKRLHGRAGERSIELRFFAPLKELSDGMASHLARAPDEDHLALAALEPGGGEEIVAVVRYAREAGSGRAEYAVLVEDRWQERGLGRAMTDRLIEAARDRGIRSLYALVTPENERMLGLLRGLELPTLTRREDGATRVELDLRQDGIAGDA